MRELFYSFFFFCVCLDFEFQKQFDAKVGDGVVLKAPDFFLDNLKRLKDDAVFKGQSSCLKKRNSVVVKIEKTFEHFGRVFVFREQ